MDLHIRQSLTKAQKDKDTDALRAAYDLIREGTPEEASSPRCFCPDLYVLCAEQALELGCVEMSSDCLVMYFEGKPPVNQFLCRAYLCQGQLTSPQTAGSVEDIEKAVIYYLKAIEISKDKPRYHFLVFNASVLYFQTVRPLLQPGARQHLVPTLTQVVKALEEVGDPDYRWRAQLMLHLVECLVDAGRGQEASSVAKATSDFMELQTPDLYPQIFSLQVRHKLSDFSKKKTEANPILSVIYKMQQLKHRVELCETRKEDAAKLKEIFLLLTTSASAQSPSSPRLAESTALIPSVERAAFLLELSLLALQLKHHHIAANCLRELKTAGVTSVGQGIMMECVQCDLALQMQEGKMKDYSKANVEARLKVIGRLDQWLQSAVKEGDAQVTQAVCAIQWNACLPLLQHNLRKKVKGTLFRVAKVLEDTHSVQLEMRCQIHTELAAVEEEEGRLQAALLQLQTALLLDQKGAHRQRLASAANLLQLRATLYQTPAGTEDKAAMLIQQAKNGQPQEEVTARRPMLVDAGLLLAPDTFQAVLDADSTVKIPTGASGTGPVAQLSAKAQHHAACVQKVEGHLARQGDGNNDRERVRLWAALAKTARKQEVWDVCRAACRFCLLYDDGRWTTPKTHCESKEDESPVEGLHGDGRLLAGRLAQSTEKDLLGLLAEVCFINAEATIHKLRSEGVQLNSPAVPPEERGVRLTEDNPHWAVYRDWIQELSAHATSNFLRAAELGAEIGEAWLAANAAVYIWNYNSHLLTSGGQQRLLPTFHRLVELLRQTGHAGEPVLLVLLCEAVAQGLIQPWCEMATKASQERLDSGARGAPPGEKPKRGAGKGIERTGSIQVLPLDPAALPDVRKALELCDYALHQSNGNTPGDSVPVAARRRVIATWLWTKRLLQQQVGQKLDIDDECKNESVSAMTRVLVGVEMLRCNSDPGQMEFSVPALSTLVRMASDCRWSDPVVELHVWTHLACFSQQAQDHNLVMTCTHNALQLEGPASQRLKVTAYALYSPSAVQEMLSSVACLRGLSMVHKSSGHPHSYREALNMLQSSVSYAACAGDPVLCMAAARHYWNSCLPLTETPLERQHLREPLERILRACAQTCTKPPTGKGKRGVTLNDMPSVAPQLRGVTLNDMPSVAPQLEVSSTGGPEDDLALRAAMHGLLFHIHADRCDWKSALQVLDQAIRDMPHTRHRLLLFTQRVLVRARLGESVLMDMQKFTDEGELCCSRMWRRVALCDTGDTIQQLTCYQNSITSLLSVEGQWQKVDYLLEFAEWLYCHHFPQTLGQVQWAIDILLLMDVVQGEGDEACASGPALVPVKRQSHIGVKAEGVKPAPSLTDLREVKRLYGLVRAHTLLAAMVGRASPQHQQNLIRAYSLVLQIWQVSMETAREAIRETVNNPPIPTEPSLSATSRKGKDKEKDKGKKSKEPPPVEEKPRRRLQEEVVCPSSPEDWAQYRCPEDLRQAFRRHATQSINQQTQSLFFLDLLVKELQSLSLTHLTLPIMHLAEVIAHDLLDRRSLSALYRLRIVQCCCQLDMEASAAYREKLLGLTVVHENEQMECRKAIALQRERSSLRMDSNGNRANEKSAVDHIGLSVRQGGDLCAQDIWLDKAEICLDMGLFQPARQLLAEARLVAEELGDQAAMARSLHSLAVLANMEQNHPQALALLEKAQDVGGDEEFWYHLTMTLVQTTVALRGQDTDTKVDQIIKQGCGALKIVLEQRPNRAPALRFLMARLETRGAVERVRLANPAEPGETLCTRAVPRLLAACDTLRETATEFLELGHREQAAEALLEHAHALRILAKHTDNQKGKQRHLLDAYSLTQQAVSEQEHVVLNAQSLFPSLECRPLTLPAMRKLLRLRLTLADVSLAMLEQVCAEEKTQALAQDRKASVERTLEEFVRATPDLTSAEQEWVCVGQTLGQVALGQLAIVNSLSLDSVEARARSLCLAGKSLRLLALQRDPLYPSTLWDGCSMDEKEGWLETKAAPGEEEEEEEEDLCEENSGKSSELQRKRGSSRLLLAQASETLAQAISLCLQHKLPGHILSEACLNMLECHGRFDPAAVGQYLALLQSCSCVAMMADVLRSSCSDAGSSQLSALLSLHRTLLPGQEDRPSSILGGVEDSLNSLSKAYNYLTIEPNHLDFLGELPFHLRILLLQHTDEGSALYGAFYEGSKPTESQKGKAMQVPGTLVCTRVAKVSVHPRALLRLRDKTRALGHESRHALLKEARWHGDGARDECGHKSDSEQKMESHFQDVVQEMENYLHPILSQFDFSCRRLQTPSIPIPESTKPKQKEEKTGPDKVGSPAELGECVVILADRMLLELPLEALAVMQETGLSSVSRDLSLQLLHSRLQREEPVESDNKKEPKGGKGAKGKGDQSKAIKVVPLNRVLPPNALPVDTHNFKYIIDPDNEGESEGGVFAEKMKLTLEAHGQCTPLWEGFMGSERPPSLAEVEQLLTNCSAFIFHGMECFLANILPAKLASLNLSECQMAILFDRVQNGVSRLRPSELEVQKSGSPLETVVLLSLSGVRCVMLNQWPSSPQRNSHNMEAIMENLLRVGLTSGQTVHALRKGEVQATHRVNTAGPNGTVFQEDSDVKRDGSSADAQQRVAPSPSAFNCIIYGLPNLVVT